MCVSSGSWGDIKVPASVGNVYHPNPKAQTPIEEWVHPTTSTSQGLLTIFEA